MRRVTPKVFLLGETQINEAGLADYLKEIGALGWTTDTKSGSEKLTEVMGRVCYRAFGAGLNANISKVREGNQKYLGNIASSKHGSVMEHAVVNFVFHNVSRVFTHELVRHRAGTAMSQESLRYVRLTDLGLFLPSCVANDPVMVELFEKTFKDLEQLQLEMAKAFKLDEPGTDFTYKKTMTSTMRRIAPIGLATSIGFSMNHRALRHILAMRTSRHAEEEIRLVFEEVGRICKSRWPNIYQDFTVLSVEGIDEYSPKNPKI